MHELHGSGGGDGRRQQWGGLRVRQESDCSVEEMLGLLSVFTGHCELCGGTRRCMG